jgi:pyrroloquinoline quinone biosynthesis protein B
MLVRVLGSGAGGGFPQWNCACHNCQSVREGRPGFTPRTQSSLAVSGDGQSWALLNASPDLRQQIAATPCLHARPEDGLRNSPIKAVIMTNGDVDHMSGVINLREAQPFNIYATRRVLDIVENNSIFRILASETVAHTELPLDEPIAIAGADTDLGLLCEAFAVPGKIALYLEDAAAGPGFGTQVGDTVGLKITATRTGKTFFYIPGCAALESDLRRRLDHASHVFFDGTLYDDDEMIRAGLMQKTGPRMGHISMSGANGSIAAFGSLAVSRKIFVHINNSNPVLDEQSPERRAVEAAGWEVGFDGMEIRL